MCASKTPFCDSQLDEKEFQAKLVEEEERLKSLLPPESEADSVTPANEERKQVEGKRGGEGEGEKEEGEGEGEGGGEGGEGEGEGDRRTKETEEGEVEGGKEREDVAKQIAVVKYLRVSACTFVCNPDTLGTEESVLISEVS